MENVFGPVEDNRTVFDTLGLTAYDIAVVQDVHLKISVVDIKGNHLRPQVDKSMLKMDQTTQVGVRRDQSYDALKMVSHNLPVS